MSTAIAATPKDTLFQDGTASLYRFRPTTDESATSVPFLLIPSMINRWYVLDLRPGASVAEAMVEAGIDTYLLDWGTPHDEDRYRTWDDAIDRIARMVRRVKRAAGSDKVALLGYCMGGTLSSIYAALNPDEVAAFVSLTAPVDFSHAGMLGALVDERWFDPHEMTAPGNLSAPQMQAGFTSLRPTGEVSKWVMVADRWRAPGFMDGFKALDTWASDNIPFPAKTYQTYIEDLYQKNALIEGEHWAKGERVDLGQIDCPLMTVVASRDNICPPAAATALNRAVSSSDVTTFEAKGGHVGAVVGSRAPTQLYPAIAQWLTDRFPAESDEDQGPEVIEIHQNAPSNKGSMRSNSRRKNRKGAKNNTPIEVNGTKTLDDDRLPEEPASLAADEGANSDESRH